MLKYESLYAFTVMKKKAIAIFTFLYGTSKFETFAEILFHEIYHIVYQWYFSRELLFVVYANITQATKIISIPSRYVFLSLKSFLTFLRLPKITRVKTHLKSRLKNEVAHHYYQMDWWGKLFLWWNLCAWKVLR